MAEQIESHILKKYQILQRLGKGAYGVVWKAIDKQTKQVVAIKKVFDAFHNATDAQRTFRQVIFLQELIGHENIVSLLGLIKAQNNKDIYLIFDFMQTDLHLAIRAGILQQIHKQYIIYQSLKSLKYIHSGQVIHRDLKPSNILLDSNCLAKIADFGLARSIAQNQGTQNVLTQYVATRWYRAPEILLGSNRYTKAVDVWSMGCILGQMINGKPIFPGNSTLNQIQKILQLIGKPSRQDIDSIDSSLAKQIIDQIPSYKKKTFSSFFPKASEQALDLLKKMLTFNPIERITIQQALRHKYLVDFSDPCQQKTLKEPIKIDMDENVKFSIKQYRQALYYQILKRSKKNPQKQKNIFTQNMMNTQHYVSKQIQSGKNKKQVKKNLQNNVNVKQQKKQFISSYKENNYVKQYKDYSKSRQKITKDKSIGKDDKSYSKFQKSDNKLNTSSNLTNYIKTEPKNHFYYDYTKQYNDKILMQKSLNDKKYDYILNKYKMMAQTKKKV